MCSLHLSACIARVQVCKLALATLLPALLVPGLVHALASPIAVDALVMLQVGSWQQHIAYTALISVVSVPLVIFMVLLSP